MKKGLKIVGVLFGVVVLLFVVLLVLAQVLITPERVRETVLPMAAEALNGREVALGDIEVSLFSGIRLEGLRVSEPKSTEDFVAAESVVLRYRLLPLLFGRVMVDTVRLVGPTIRVERLADGRFNFSDLVEGTEEEGSAESSGDGGGGGPSIDLLVSKVAIEKGEVVFLDHAIGADPPYRTKVSDLQLTASDISLDRSFPFAVQATINKAALEVKGEVDPATSGGKAEIRLGDFDVMAFAPYFRDQVPGKLSGLTVGLDLRAEGNPQKLHSTGEISLTGIDYLPPESEQALLVDSVRLDHNVEIDLGKDQLKIAETKLHLNSIPLQISGQIAKLTGEQQLDLVLAIDQLDLNEAVQSIPAAFRQSAADLDPAGVVDVNLHLAGAATGDPAALLKDGAIGLREVMVTAGGIRPALSGRLLLAGDSLTSKDLELRAGENKAALDLRVAQLLGKTIAVNSGLTAKRFDLDALLATVAAPAAADRNKAGQQSEAAAAEEIGPLDLPLKVDGAVQIGETVYRGLAMTDFDLRYRLVDNVLTVEQLGGKLAQGSFNQTARVDLGVKGLAYDTRLKVAGVMADPFVKAFLPSAAGTVFGTLNLDGSFGGKGTLPETLKKHLTGKGDFALTDGKLTGAGLVENLAAYLNLEELRVMQFSKAAGKYVIEKGKVRIDGDFDGSDVRMAPQGTVGLDGRVDLALNARLSPKLSDRLGSDLGKFLADDEGWTQLPLKVAGSWDSPSFKVDSSAVRRKAKEKVRQELKEKLLDKIAPKKEGEESGTTEDPERKLLEDAVRGLFGN